MFCEICKKKITYRKHLFNLFQIERHHICEYCYEKYPLIIRSSVIPIDGGEVTWLSLIQTSEDISPLAHMSFYKPFMIEYLTYHKDSVLLMFDQISEDWFILFDKIALGDIYLLTLYDNIEKKESYYEI